jgi:hypothetical protein
MNGESTRLNHLTSSCIPIRYFCGVMPKPIRHCSRCRAILPPWSRIDSRYCGNVCRQAEHRERHRFRRCRTASAPTASAPIKLRDQRVTAADIEALMAATDATVERVMANVSKIVKPSAKGSHDCNPQLLRRVSESPILAGAVLWFA